MNFRMVLVPVLAAGLLAAPAFGHHVSPLIDYEKKVEVSGTVKQLRWTNPHSRMILTVGEADWDLEMSSPGMLTRRGWSPTLVSPGDRVTVTIYPQKDGMPGGQAVSVKTPDGKVVQAE